MKTKIIFTCFVSVASLSTSVGAQAKTPSDTPYGRIDPDRPNVVAVAAPYSPYAGRRVDFYFGGMTDNSISNLFESAKTSARATWRNLGNGSAAFDLSTPAEVFQFSNTSTLASQIVDRSDDGQLGIDDVLQGAVAPEPSTWAMMILGVVGVGAVARRRGKVAGDVQTA